jgi:hypothetical protein
VFPTQQNRVNLIQFLSDKSKIIRRLNQAGYADKSRDELAAALSLLLPGSNPPPKSLSELFMFWTLVNMLRKPCASMSSSALSALGLSSLSASAEIRTTILPKDSTNQVLFSSHALNLQSSMVFVLEVLSNDFLLEFWIDL